MAEWIDVVPAYGADYKNLVDWEVVRVNS